MVRGLDKVTIYFNFRLDIGINNFNDMNEFVFVTKPMKGRESKIPIHPVTKNPKNDSQQFVKCSRHQLCHV